jgi:DNA-directed RNA polymerase beta subunit
VFKGYDMESKTLFDLLPQDKPQVTLRPDIPSPPVQPAITTSPASYVTAPRMRDFGDAIATRNLIYEKVLNEARNLQPLEDDRHSLSLTNVDWADPERFTRKQRKAAILAGQTLARRMRGEWVLRDKATGQPIESRKQIIGAVPYMSSMGTFLHNGNEYTINNQQRLRPGVFARIKDNGEVESHFNIMPGKGVSHRYFLDPAKGVFKLKIAQAEMPLMPLIKALGATDAELREAWGSDLVTANYGKDDGSTTLNKIAAKLLSAKELQGASGIIPALMQKFSAMELDPEVTQSTLGKGFDRVSKEAILAATSKLLKVSRREAKPDDRDHLAYQTFLGPEDLFAERVRKDHGNIRRQVFREVSKAGSLAKMKSGILTPQLNQLLIGSGLAQALEEINPAEVFGKQSRITRLGEGGIPSVESIPDEARSVQPSHMGFMDPSITPECYDAITEVMTSGGWKFWKDVTAEDYLACNIEGRLEWHRPEALHSSYYRGEMFGAKAKNFSYLVTPNHRLWARGKEDNSYKIEMAEACHFQHRVFSSAHLPLVGSEYSLFALPDVSLLRTNEKPLGSFDINDWCELLGWFLVAGSVVWREEEGDYRTLLSRSRVSTSSNCDRVEKLLRRMDLRYSFNASTHCYSVASKQLTSYFRRFGLSADRYIPDIFLQAPLVARQRLLEGLLLADGHKAHHAPAQQFLSSSASLADTVQQLAFSLGRPATVRFSSDDRKSPRNDYYVVTLHNRIEYEIKKPNYSKVDYDGMVYCATVPGGLLYVRRGITPGHWSGNSFRVGVDLNMSAASRKGDDGKIYTKLTDKTGQTVWKTPQELRDSVITAKETLLDPFFAESRRVPVMKGGKIDYIDRDKVDYVIPSFNEVFSPLTNLIPIMAASKPGRVATGARYITQAMPLKNVEAPMVQGRVPGEQDQSYEELYGKHMGAVRADKPGTVLGFADGVLSVQYDDGTKDQIELYQHHPFNRKTEIHQDPVVRPGERFNAGSTLVRSNYTDGAGTTALGLNMRVAYIPYKGFNFEDAQVISESAAKRLTSNHLYQFDLEVSDKHKIGKNAFVSLFAGKFDKATLEKMDDKGVVRVGEKVEFGQPLVLAAKERDRAANKIHKKRQPGYADESILWEHHSPGIVTDVAQGKNGPVVLVTSEAQAQVGDKLSGRYGDKGVIAAIVPDDQMPRDAEGKPFEVLLGPDGIITRTNPSQTIEAALGKIAAKTGKPVKVPSFSDIDDLEDWAEKELAKHGLKGTEDVYWPEKNTTAPGIGTGYRFLMKLHHTAESKGQGRDSGAYSADETPAKGGSTGCFAGTTEIVVNGDEHNGEVYARHVLPIRSIVQKRTEISLPTVKLPHKRSQKPEIIDSKVSDWFTYVVSASELVTIELENGESFTCTRNHELITSTHRRVKAGEVSPGDDLLGV